MTPTVDVVITIFLVVGCVLGWHGQKARAAHGDVKVTKGRLPGFRRTRLRSSLWVLVVAVVTFLALRDVLH